jgi:hypothetical protein
MQSEISFGKGDMFHVNTRNCAAGQDMEGDKIRERTTEISKTA